MFCIVVFVRSETSVHEPSAGSSALNNTYRNTITYSPFKITRFFRVVLFLSKLFIRLFNAIVSNGFYPITAPDRNFRRQPSRLLNTLCSPICPIKFRETIVISLKLSKLNFMDPKHCNFNYARSFISFLFLGFVG